MGKHRGFRRLRFSTPILCAFLAIGYAVFGVGQIALADSSATPSPQATQAKTEPANTPISPLGTPGKPATRVSKPPATPNPSIKPSRLPLINGNGGQPNTGTVSGTGSGSPVVVSWSVTADGSVQVSNLSITITGGGCNASTDVSIPTLSAGQSDSGTWNTGCVPNGTYTITLCWSTGNGNRNCNIASGSTSGGTVPTFGPELAVLAVLLLGIWLWRNREQFQATFNSQTPPGADNNP